MKKIKYVSLSFRVIFQFIFITLIFLHIKGWIQAPQNTNFFNVIPAFYRPIINTISLHAKLMGFLITTMPLIIKLILIYSLIKLFRLYEHYEFFSIKNVLYIRNVGFSLLALQIIHPLCRFFLGFVLTANNPEAYRLAIFTIDDTNVGLIFTAFIVILISWIVSEGCKLNEEQQLTI